MHTDEAQKLGQKGQLGRTRKKICFDKSMFPCDGMLNRKLCGAYVFFKTDLGNSSQKAATYTHFCMAFQIWLKCTCSWSLVSVCLGDANNSTRDLFCEFFLGWEENIICPPFYRCVN